MNEVWRNTKGRSIIDVIWNEESEYSQQKFLNLQLRPPILRHFPYLDSLPRKPGGSACLIVITEDFKALSYEDLDNKRISCLYTFITTSPKPFPCISLLQSWLIPQHFSQHDPDCCQKTKALTPVLFEPHAPILRQK